MRAVRRRDGGRVVGGVAEGAADLPGALSDLPPRGYYPLGRLGRSKMAAGGMAHVKLNRGGVPGVNSACTYNGNP